MPAICHRDDLTIALADEIVAGHAITDDEAAQLADAVLAYSPVLDALAIEDDLRTEIAAKLATKARALSVLASTSTAHDQQAQFAARAAEATQIAYLLTTGVL